MTYRITYTTDTRPTDLPDGATVEKVSALPLSLQSTDSNARWIRVESSTYSYLAAFLNIDGRGAHLDRDQTLQVRDALTELLGETADWDGISEPPAYVLETRDRDGDRWFQITEGKWSTVEGDRYGLSWNDESGTSPSRYAPHQIHRRK